MNRWDIINYLIKKNNYTKYLEIGVQNNRNFNKIDCPSKVGVDPAHNSNPTFNITSDEFFKINKGVYDIIFLDGKHEAEQTYNDIVNSLKVLTPNGTIVVHDCNPQLCEHQLVPRVCKHWNGDVWKSILKLRKEKDDIFLFTVDTDEGCCIIQKGKQIKLNTNVKVNFSNFTIYRKEWLNLVSVVDFLKWINGDNCNI